MTEPTPADKMKLLSDIVGSQATLEEKKIAADTLKALAEYEKASAENRNHTKISREETYRTIATVLVPLLTVATLFITIVFQWLQYDATDRANEDGRWKIVVETMTKEAMTPTTDIVVVTGLLPFFSSERYKDQANDTMLLMSSRLSNALAFETLFKTAFGKATWENLPRLVRLDQILTRQLKEQLADEKRVAESLMTRQQATTDIQTVLNGLLVPFGSVGPPGQPGVPVWAMPPPGGRAPREEELKALQKEVVEPRRGRWGPRGELTPEDVRYFQAEVREQKSIVARSVAALLKETRLGRVEVSADLTGFDFRAMNLEKANFTNLVIDKVDFDHGVVSDAVLQPKSFLGSSWRGVQWWKANKISSDLLKYLLTTANPLVVGDDYWNGISVDQRPERGSVVEGIRKRCESVKLKCDTGLLQTDGGTSRN